ncbi:CoA-binding protein [Rhodoferax saidenbachensis]|uniref:CoA-binding protein n=1 Tax=Rhodoferax saidenbachensis TaxID=1484693 RepID=A0ABU1ZSX1_9BURK|nr:CoA-binding protein [Rhodoferax saidenbachensis]MDR7308588.1 putative CoA-binding protein [Rhodoferax saidenbachensis]
MTTPLTEAQTIAHLVSKPLTVAVVGLSPKTHRDSFGVAQYMQAHGWRIVPINPNASEILGEKAYPTLTEAAQHERIELVNVFRNSADVPPVVDEAIAIGAPAIWLQLGIAHEVAAAKARAAGLLVVQNKCLKVEHARHA